MGVPKEEREQDTENLFEEIMTENFPPGERNRLTSPESTENTKQKESKEDHTKTHHN